MANLNPDKVIGMLPWMFMLYKILMTHVLWEKAERKKNVVHMNTWTVDIYMYFSAVLVIYQ